MNQKNDWLRDVPENQGFYPSKENDPSEFFKLCPRLRVNVLLDKDNHCLRQPKENICDGCIAYNLLRGRG